MEFLDELEAVKTSNPLAVLLALALQWMDTNKSAFELFAKLTLSVSKADYDKNKAKYQTEAPKIETQEFINKHTGEIMRVPKGIDSGFYFNADKQKRQWDKYGHLPDCDGLSLNAFGKKACAKKVIKIRGYGNWKSNGLLSAGDIPESLKLPMPVF